MGNIKFPRSGSMQFWPRKKARRAYPKIHAWKSSDKAKLLGFAGYKVGMTHIIVLDNSASTTAKMEISIPVTVVECPPLKIASVVFYKSSPRRIISEVLAEKLDKELSRKITLPKNRKHTLDNIKDFDDIRVKVYTQPRLTGFGQKKPQLFEISLGGKKEDKLAFVKENLGKEIKLQDVFAEGELLDAHGVTKGKGFQGPVKRFGVNIRSHKAEKTKRGPGSLGGWKAQGKIMYRVAHAGQMGFHTRTEYNKWILKIADNGKEITPKGGYTKYGVVKNTYMFIKGSISGSRKRLVLFTRSIRPNKNTPSKAPEIRFLAARPEN